MIDEPSLRQRWIGTRLAALRHDAGLSLQQASDAAERSTASLSRIENGLVSLRPRDLRPLLDAYGVTEGDLRETLIAVAGEIQAERRGWWVEHDDDLSPSYRDLLRLESTATHIRTYETTVLPGLLQHEDYARAAVRATGADDLSEDDLDHFVAIRKQRQHILTCEENPVAFHAVLHEAALHEHLGKPAVLPAQAEHLRNLCELPNVNVQLLPLAAGAHPALTGAFTVLSMSHLDFAHVELMTSDVYVEDPVGVQRYRDAFQTLTERALPPDESAPAIADKITMTAESTPRAAR
ncbi:helix-turn-helix transcriptional regulator [Streptomonospora halophila]|uniref:Helix-turn-helix transcriptional regulator n=1 Tax=Streptomonospora halophila TaxID=427369 RepID=A0ABP9GBP4_9ACTN